MATPEETSAAAAAAAKAQNVGPGDGNDDANVIQGNPVPPAPSNEPPAPTAEEKAAADAKAAEDKDAADKIAAAEKAATDKAAQTEKENTPLNTDEWGSTGNDVADSVLTMLQNADVSPEEAKALLFDAVTAGDLSKIDLEGLEEKVGQTKATLIMAGVTTFVNDKNARNTQIVADIKEAAGGEENWTKMAAWAKGNLPDAELVEYRGMVDEGGAQARFAVAEIAAKYNADEANTSLTTAGVAPIQGDGGVAGSARSISRADYVAELTKAHRNNASEAVLNEITAARHRGRAQGL